MNEHAKRWLWGGLWVVISLLVLVSLIRSVHHWSERQTEED